MLVVVANVATTTTGRFLSTPEWENELTNYVQ